jgi:hypothetical protein
MENIKLISYKENIERRDFVDIYESKLTYLKKMLLYLDKVGIPADIILNYDDKHERLSTWVEIECEDEGFKKILILVTENFNTYPESN